MFCRDCGKPIPEGSTSCEFCSKAAEEQVSNSENVEEVKAEETAAETIAEEVKAEEASAQEQASEEAEAPAAAPVVEQPKKKSLKLPIIAAVVAVVAILGCVFAFSSKAQTLVMKMSSPETHYRYALGNSVSAFSDSFIDLYDESVKFCGTAAKEETKSANVAAEGSLYVELDGMLKEKIDEIGITENKLSVDYKINSFGKVGALDLALSAGSEKIATLEFRFDDEFNVSFAIPELNQKAVRINLKNNEYINMDEIQEDAMPSVGISGLDGLLAADSAETEEMLRKVLTSISENAPDSKLLEKLLEKYIKIVLEQITEVERVSEDLEIEGIVQSTTRFDLKINEKLVFNICKAVLTEAKDDKDIKTFIEEYYNAIIKIAEDMEADVEEMTDMTASDLYTEFKDAVTDFLDDMTDYDEEDLDTKAAIKLTMWVNSSSETVAVKIKIPSADAEIFVGSAVDGKETGYEFYMKDSTMTVLAVTAKTTEAKGKISGKVNIEASDKEFVELEIKDFDVKAFEENGYINGTFILEPGKDFAEEVGAEVADESIDISKVKFEMTFATSEKSASAEFKLKYDGDALVTLGSKADMKDATEVSLHSDYTEDIEAWATEMDPTSLLEKIQNVLGENLPLEELMSGMTGTAEPSYPAVDEYSCQMCGGSPYTYVDVEGEEWLVCEDCYNSLYGWDF